MTTQKLFLAVGPIPNPHNLCKFTTVKRICIILLLFLSISFSNYVSLNCFYTVFSSVMVNKELYMLVDGHLLPGASVDLMPWMGGHQHGKRSLNSIKNPCLTKRLFVMMKSF